MRGPCPYCPFSRSVLCDRFCRCNRWDPERISKLPHRPSSQIRKNVAHCLCVDAQDRDRALLAEKPHGPRVGSSRFKEARRAMGQFAVQLGTTNLAELALGLPNRRIRRTNQPTVRWPEMHRRFWRFRLSQKSGEMRHLTTWPGLYRARPSKARA